jgi:peptide methionine sulfoxide reductase MsrA
MIVIPDHFVKEHKRMFVHAKIVEYNQGTIANPRFDKLNTSLRTAVEKSEGTLDKDATSYHDILDAFRLPLQFYY